MRKAQFEAEEQRLREEAERLKSEIKKLEERIKAESEEMDKLLKQPRGKRAKEAIYEWFTELLNRYSGLKEKLEKVQSDLKFFGKAKRKVEELLEKS